MVGFIHNSSKNRNYPKIICRTRPTSIKINEKLTKLSARIGWLDNIPLKCTADSVNTIEHYLPLLDSPHAIEHLFSQGFVLRIIGWLHLSYHVSERTPKSARFIGSYAGTTRSISQCHTADESLQAGAIHLRPHHRIQSWHWGW